MVDSVRCLDGLLGRSLDIGHVFRRVTSCTDRTRYRYKGYGAGIIDKDGTKDRNEFYNVGFPPPYPTPTPHSPRSAK